MKPLSAITSNLAALGALVGVLAWIGFLFTRERLAFFGHALLPPDKWWESAFYVMQGLEVALHLATQDAEPFVVLALYLALVVTSLRLPSGYRRTVRLLIRSPASIVVVGVCLVSMISHAFANVRIFAREVAMSQLRDQGCYVPVFEVDVQSAIRFSPNLTEYFAEADREFFGYLMTVSDKHLLYVSDRRDPTSGPARGISIPVAELLSIPTIRRDRHANPNSVGAASAVCP